MSRSDRGDGALFALDAEHPEGWFPVQSLKINRARPVKRGIGDAAPYMQGEVYYNFVVCNAVRPYRLFYCYSLP